MDEFGGALGEAKGPPASRAEAREEAPPLVARSDAERQALPIAEPTRGAPVARASSVPLVEAETVPVERVKRAAEEIAAAPLARRPFLEPEAEERRPDHVRAWE